MSGMYKYIEYGALHVEHPSNFLWCVECRNIHDSLFNLFTALYAFGKELS